MNARHCDNVLECYLRGCADIVAKEAVFEESAEETFREPQQEGSNGITEHRSREDNFGDVSVNDESALDSEPHSCDTGDVEKDEPFAEDSSESGVWIMGVRLWLSTTKESMRWPSEGRNSPFHSDK